MPKLHKDFGERIISMFLVFIYDLKVLSFCSFLEFVGKEKDIELLKMGILSRISEITFMCHPRKKKAGCWG